MKKVVSFTVLYICLFILEILFDFISVLLLEYDFQYEFDMYLIRRAWLGTLMMNYFRLLFYGLPFLIVYYLLFKYVASIKLHKPILFSLFNLFVHVGLLVLSRFILGSDAPILFDNSFFWINCIAIFLSPLILGRIPFFKKLMGILI